VDLDGQMSKLSLASDSAVPGLGLCHDLTVERLRGRGILAFSGDLGQFGGAGLVCHYDTLCAVLRDS